MSGYSGYQGNVAEMNGNVQECAKPDTSKKKTFQTFVKANINDDKLTVDLDSLQSQGTGLYYLDNQHGCECGLKEARDIQVSQPGINFSGGVGWIAENGCLIDNDSGLRQDKDKLTNKKEINQIVERLFKTTPGISRGFHNVDVESVLISSNFSTDQKPCNSLAGVSIGNYFTPMIPKLKEEVQDSNHIIPEDSQRDWVRGGLPTRQMVRNDDYLRRCQDKTAVAN
tara:strand:- start:22 stop:699 length:678 start_codon:yes stop_codon:yes gene_type:complete